MPGGIHPPLSVIASWPKPNYVDPPTRGYGLVILCSILGFFSVLTVGLRLWTRATVTKNFGSDDWVMVVAMPIVIAMTVACCLASKVYYFDRHTWDVPLKGGLVQTRQITFVIELLYVHSVALIKISILLFYQRLSRGILSKGYKWVIWAMIAFVIGYQITFTFTMFFQCKPFSAFWNQVDIFWKAEHEFSCHDDAPLLLAASGVSVAQDFLVAGMPTIMFARMDIPIRQKLAMALVFAVGFFLCIAGVLRMVYIGKIFEQTYDVVWIANEAWVWTAVEVLMGTIVASVPALKIFVQRHLETMISSRYGYGQSATGPSQRGPSRMSAGLNKITGRKSKRMNDNAWAWQRTPSNVEGQDPEVGSGRDIAMDRLEKQASYSVNGRDTPIEHARKITAADLSTVGSEKGGSVDYTPRPQNVHSALNSHPITPISPTHNRFRSEDHLDDKAYYNHNRYQSGDYAESKGGTFFSDQSMYTSDSFDDTTEGRGGFDPDANALPILTEQESRDMGLVGMAR